MLVSSHIETEVQSDFSSEQKMLRDGVAVIRNHPSKFSDDLLDRAHELVKLAQKLGDKISAGYLHANIIRMLCQLSRHRESHEYGETVLSELRKLDDNQPLMAALNALSAAANNYGDFASSMEFANGALQIARQLNRYDAIGHITSNIGLDFTYMGEYDQALEYFKQSLEAWEKAEDSEGKAHALLNQGLVYSHFQDFNAAQSAFYEALELYQKAEDISGIAATYRNLSDCSMIEGKK
jgi:tetratricopeptide (TPR) repeat protein